MFRARGQSGAEPLRRPYGRRRTDARACRLPVTARNDPRARRGKARQPQWHRHTGGCIGLSTAGTAGRGGDRRSARHRQNDTGTRTGAGAWDAHPAPWCCAATRSASDSTAHRLSSGCHSPPTVRRQAKPCSANSPPWSPRQQRAVTQSSPMRHSSTPAPVMLAAAAHAAGVPFVGLWLHAPFAVLEARIANRVTRCIRCDNRGAARRQRRQPRPGDWIAVEAAETAETAARPGSPSDPPSQTVEQVD